MIANSWVQSCPSTNDLAKELAHQGAPHGTWIASKNQTAGRGRSGRSWTSLEGNLFFSIILRIPQKQLWTWVPLATGISIAETLDLQIKWPNDLLKNGKKIGGILCESSYGTGSNPFIVAGIGLNCSAAPANLDQPTESLNRPAEEVLQQILKPLLESIDSAQIDTLKTRFAARSTFKIGTTITWSNKIGRYKGLGESGELLVESEGTIISLFAEDVHLHKGTPT